MDDVEAKAGGAAMTDGDHGVPASSTPSKVVNGDQIRVSGINSYCQGKNLDAASAETLRLSGRKIKERFYTVVKAPDGAPTDGMMHFRCRCGKVRVQSIKHGYTNLKQHVWLKHRDWVLACVDDLQITPPSSPRATGSGSGKGSGSGRKKRKSSVSLVEDTKNAIVIDDAADPEMQDDTSRQPARASTSAPADPLVMKKRQNYISWDDYFMSVAFLSAMRSKDPSTQVGACIVNTDKKIVGIGYNGFPNGCDDDELPWSRESRTGDPLETKYPFVCHAEMNAILNKNSSDLKDCTIYVALFPCNECAKLIIQCGIKHIVYYSDKYHDDWKFVASRHLLDMAHVSYRQHQLEKTKLVIDFSSVL